LLPLLSLLTICLLSISVEFIARRIFVESATTTLGCLVVNDPSTGVRAIPNSVCTQKIFESALTEYRVNSCGHRAGMECGPKDPGKYRIVLVGSSFAYGMWVQREQSFAALLPKELSQRSGRTVELYNQSMQWGMPRSVKLRFNEALAADPDLILWPIASVDIENVEDILPYVAPREDAGTETTGMDEPGGMLAKRWRRIAVAFSRKTVADLVRDGWKRALLELNETRTVFLLQHFLYQSQSQTVKHYLARRKGVAYLDVEPSAAWQGKLQQFESYVADVLAQAKAARVPVVVVVLPIRAQAAMISRGEWPADFDPYKMGGQIRTIVEKHGGIYKDILHDFRRIPNPERYYLPVDGHLDVGGHEIVSGLLAKALGDMPGLAAAPPPTSGGSR
jgi:hypothetical protein